MNRRTILALLAGAGVGAYGVGADGPRKRAARAIRTGLPGGSGADVGSEPGEGQRGAVDNPTPGGNPMQTTFGRPSYGFQALTWQGDGTAVIEFEDGHGMDGFGIMHKSETDTDIALVLESAPEGHGYTDVAVRRELETINHLYASRWFKLVAYTGVFDDRKKGANEGMDIVDERLGSVPFTIPASVMPDNRLE